MKTIEIFEYLDDEVKSICCGIFYDENHKHYVAMSFTQSKNFKTEKGARNWIARFL